MSKGQLGTKEEELLNTNETMNDYSFFFQMICESRKLDFESGESKSEDTFCD
jgi:hypothetical protein